MSRKRFRSTRVRRVLLFFRVDQGEAAFRVVFLAQMCRALRQYDLQRRAHLALDQMAGKGRAVVAPEDTVDMQRGLAVRADSDISRQRCYLDLLPDWVALIFFGLPVEIAERRRCKRADRRELSCGNAFLVSDL